MARASDPVLAQRAATLIVRTLREHGHIAYLAGGCVRDALLGLHPTDFDVATDAVPERVRALFPRTQEIGAAFGVVLVSIRPEDFGLPHARSAGVEVATFRADGPYHDSRRPQHVTFSDPHNDANRRDFTINALFLDPLAPPDGSTPPGSDVPGRVIDLVGGLHDLRARVVRAVGDPDARLAEDHLRALRAVRFAARLGFSLDPGTAQAITRHAAQLRGVSRERIGEEIRRMLAHPAAAAALEMLVRLRLDAPVLSASHIDTPLTLSRQLAASQCPVTLIATWLTDRHRAAGSHVWLSDADAGLAVRDTRSALCLSNEESDALRDILHICNRLPAWSVGMGVAARKRLACKAMFDKALQIFSASDPAAGSTVGRDVAALAGDGIGLSPDPLVTGDTLVAAGWRPGPRFKAVLDAVYDGQLEGRVRTMGEAMELAERLRV